MTATQIQCVLPGGVSRTVYAVVLQDNTAYNGTAMESFTLSNWTAAKYCLTMAEMGGSGTTGIYYLAFPSGLPAGLYAGIVCVQSGGSPSYSADTRVASGPLQWDGAKLVALGLGVRTSYPMIKNTAFSGFEFAMNSSTTHLPKPGLSAFSTMMSRDGTAFVATTYSPVEIGYGTYSLNFSASDLNANTVTLRVAAAGADDLLLTFVLQG